MRLATKLEIDKWILRLTYENGVVKEIDARKYFSSEGFRKSQTAKQLLKDPQLLQSGILEDGVAITWPSGFAVDTDEIYDLGTPIRQPQTALVKALRRLT